MADCSKTVDFLREWKRMCDNKVFSELCTCCPMNYKGTGRADMTCSMYARAYPDYAIAIVQKWSDEHPAQTWEGKLRELLPNAPIHEIIHDYCPYQIFGEHAIGNHRSSCADNCIKCWNSEYKEGPTNGNQQQSQRQTL